MPGNCQSGCGDSSSLKSVWSVVWSWRTRCTNTCVVAILLHTFLLFCCHCRSLFTSHTEEETPRLPMTWNTLNIRPQNLNDRSAPVLIPAVIKLRESKVCFSRTLRPAVTFERVHPTAPSGSSRHWSESLRACFCEPFQTKQHFATLRCVAGYCVCLFFFSCYCVVGEGNIARHYVVFAGCACYPPPPRAHTHTLTPPTRYCHVFMATWFLSKHWQNACLYCSLPRPASVLPHYQWTQLHKQLVYHALSCCFVTQFLNIHCQKFSCWRLQMYGITYKFNSCGLLSN